MSTRSPVNMGFAECVGVDKCVYSRYVRPSWWLELAVSPLLRTSTPSALGRGSSHLGSVGGVRQTDVVLSSVLCLLLLAADVALLAKVQGVERGYRASTIVLAHEKTGRGLRQ
jgi:hypothetical protein